MTAVKGDKPYSILIADDDAGCRQMLREIIEPEGYQAVMASSGEEALDLMHQHEVDLAFLDVHMPSLTGLETLQMLRQSHLALPCILVTSDANEVLIRQAFKLQAYSVIPKPVSRQVVLYTVVRALVRVYGNVPGDRF